MGHIHSHPPSRPRRHGGPASTWDSRDLSDSPDEDEYDDYGLMGMTGSAVPEGARIDSSTLFDAYSRPASTGPATNSYGPYVAPSVGHIHNHGHTHDMEGVIPYPRYSGMMQRHLPPPINRSAGAPRRWADVFGSQPTATGLAAGGASLVRSSSIRRGRPRVISQPSLGGTHPATDFADFASRRRSMHRSSANHDVPDLVPSSLRSTNDTQPVIPPPSSYGTSASSSHLPHSSLFGPRSPTAQGADSPPHSASPPPPPMDTSGSHPSLYRSSTGNATFFLNGPSESNAGPAGPAPNWRVEGAPSGPPIPGWAHSQLMLRRGGVRPPELMLAAGAGASSPRPGGSSMASSLLRLSDTEPSPAERGRDEWLPGNAGVANLGPAPSSSTQSATLPEPPVNLPTPRSVSPTEEAGPSNPIV